MRINPRRNRIWAAALALLLCLSCTLGIAAEGVESQAATYKGSDYTANKAVAAALDEVFATYGDGTYFTYDGKPCTDHDTNPDCSSYGPYDCNCRRVLEDGTDMLAWQCFGYARYVFYTCFGFIDNASVSPGKYYSLGSIEVGSLTEQNVKALLTRAKTGAHIRVGGHSLAVLSTDANGITVIHANTDHQCGVRLQTMTWAQFVSLYQWRGVEYVNMPTTYPAGDTAVLPTVQSKTADDGVYILQNLSTGRVLQVSGGKDVDENPVNTAALVKNSKTQQFRIAHTEKGKYYLYAMCSSDGKNRVLDAIRDDNWQMKGGNKLEIYRATDADAQLYKLVPLADGSWVIELASASRMVVTDTVKATTHVTLETYTGDGLQHWQLLRPDGQPTVDNTGVYTVAVDEGSVLNMRSQPSTSGGMLAQIPNKTALPVTKVQNNWGQVIYQGKTGWVSLDFAKKVGVFGDVDGNKSVQAADALMALQGATKKITLTAVEKVAANVSLSGTVAASDALSILQYATQKIESLL